MNDIEQRPFRRADIVFWSGLAVAVGAFGVVVAGAFYALSPVAAALPMPDLVLAHAQAGMVAGQVTLRIAGTVGIFADVILAAGTLVLMMFPPPAGLPVERLGWALVTLSVLDFVLVDALSAGVLTQVASMDGAAAAFAGFKRLYDTLFALGTLVFGLGAIPILAGEMRSPSPILPRLWRGIGLLSAGAALVSGALYFMQIAAPHVIGASIVGGSLVFGVYGIRLARWSVRASGRSTPAP